MQTNRINHLIFPPVPASAAKPGAADAAAGRVERPARAAPPVLEDVVPPKVPVAGVTFTGSAPSAPVTYGKESAFSAKPLAREDHSPSQWVDNAVSVMRDFEAGQAALNGGVKAVAGTASPEGHAFWSGSLQGIKSAAAKLNVFA
jgi:hypothetical protein